MKLDDIRTLSDAYERVQRLFVRMIPLAHGHRFATMPAAAQRFFAAFEWIGEVHNGGVHQYFSNSAGDHWRMAVAALDGLGDVVGARALRTALAAFPPESSPSEKRWERHQALDALGAKAGITAFATAGRDVATTRDATIGHLARAVESDASELRFIDAYPSGLKALEIPDGLTLAAAADETDPFVVVTFVHALVTRGGAAPLDHATFADAFGVLDEVSAGGFATYLSQTQAGRRWREAVKALHTIGAPRHAALVERAAAAHAAAADTAALDGEHQDGRTELVTALARWTTRSST